MTEKLAKYFSGNATAEEVLQIKEWRNANRENSEEFFQYSNAWNHIKPSKEDTKGAYANILSQIEADDEISIAQKPSFASYLKYAAILILGIGVSYFVYNSELNFGSNKVAVQTTEKQTQNVTLPDGSKVYLSENSTVSYLNDFKGETREVILKGKAFFDITRNENKPFIVKTDNSEIKVLGTSFLVDTHLGKNTEVVVKTGKVSVAKKSKSIEKEIIELSPGEVGLVKNQVKKSLNTNQNYLSWQTKIIDFDRSQMSEVVKTLEEVYFVDINLSDADINNCTLSAKFDHREIDVVMEIISQTFGLGLQQKGKNKFILSGVGCAAN